MFETQGGTRNRTRDLPRKGSAFITSSGLDLICVVCVVAQPGCDRGLHQHVPLRVQMVPVVGSVLVDTAM